MALVQSPEELLSTIAFICQVHALQKTPACRFVYHPTHQQQPQNYTQQYTRRFGKGPFPVLHNICHLPVIAWAAGAKRLLVFLGNMCKASTLRVGVKIIEQDVSKNVLCLDKKECTIILRAYGNASQLSWFPKSTYKRVFFLTVEWNALDSKPFLSWHCSQIITVYFFLSTQSMWDNDFFFRPMFHTDKTAAEMSSIRSSVVKGQICNFLKYTVPLCWQKLEWKINAILITVH